MPQITFRFSPAVEATDRLESCNIACFLMILKHTHVILFCHGELWLIILGGMRRSQLSILSCEWVLCHPIHRLR